MSGGVDSSVAACLLAEQGYDVVGAHMSLVHLDGVEHGCCGPRARADAAAVAAIGGFPFEICDLTLDFDEAVIDDFVAEHAAGRTPNPCARCNGEIKFGAFLRRADELGIDLVATGHYVQTRRDDAGAWHLLRGADPAKDQSYMLHMLGQTQLARVALPGGPAAQGADACARGAIRVARGRQTRLAGAVLRAERRRGRLRAFPGAGARARGRRRRRSGGRGARPPRRHVRLHRGAAPWSRRGDGRPRLCARGGRADEPGRRRARRVVVQAGPDRRPGLPGSPGTPRRRAPSRPRCGSAIAATPRRPWSRRGPTGSRLRSRSRSVRSRPGRARSSTAATRCSAAAASCAPG